MKVLKVAIYAEIEVHDDFQISEHHSKPDVAKVRFQAVPGGPHLLAKVNAVVLNDIISKPDAKKESK